MALLEVDHLVARYGRITALQDVSLTVAEGEIVTLIGANGAGKTTTLRAVSGMLRPSGGTIRYDGQSVGGLKPHKLVERRLCACVNILPGMISHYWWQGAIERGEEVVMIVKTRASLAARVSEAVKEMHSYSTPAILVLPIESVDKPYLDWLMAETEAAAKTA